MMLVVHLMGPTGAGKSSTVRELVRQYPQIHALQVGAILRAKYPPEFFQGKAAPAHTEEEAWQLYETTVLSSLADGVRVLLVDGQPRSLRALARIQEMRNPALTNVYVWLWADAIVRGSRTDARSGQAEERKLAKERNIGDLADAAELLVAMQVQNIPYKIWITTYTSLLETTKWLLDSVIRIYDHDIK